MKQYEAVIKVMEKNGGYATLGMLYQKVLKIRGVNWGTKTPDANIRRIVQVYKDKFFKIRPGLWALKAWKKSLPDELKILTKTTDEAKKKQNLFDHSYFQGLILEIGNIQGFHTYIPPQDKNKMFLGKRRLSTMASCTRIYNFSFQNIIRNAKTIDVVWFNSRKMPAAFFEVENTSNMTRSMVKFNELRDFRTEMYIVSQEVKELKFEDIKSLDTFKSIKNFIRFLSYERLSKDHSRVCALDSFGPGIQGLYASN